MIEIANVSSSKGKQPVPVGGGKLSCHRPVARSITELTAADSISGNEEPGVKFIHQTSNEPIR